MEEDGWFCRVGLNDLHRAGPRGVGQAVPVDGGCREVVRSVGESGDIGPEEGLIRAIGMERGVVHHLHFFWGQGPVPYHHLIDEAIQRVRFLSGPDADAHIVVIRRDAARGDPGIDDGAIDVDGQDTPVVGESAMVPGVRDQCARVTCVRVAVHASYVGIDAILV